MAGAVSANAVAAVEFTFFVFVGEAYGSSPSVFNPFLGWLEASASEVKEVIEGRNEVAAALVGKKEETKVYFVLVAALIVRR